jgi:hypothetical protein
MPPAARIRVNVMTVKRKSASRMISEEKYNSHTEPLLKTEDPFL